MFPRRRCGLGPWALILLGGCVISNPAFDGEGTGGASSLDTSGSLSGIGSEGGSSVSAGTTGTTGTTGTSSSSSASGSSTTSGTSTVGPSTTEDPGSGSDSDGTTTGDGVVQTLQNYGEVQECDRGPLCIDMMTSEPIRALHRVTECFESPLPPPLSVSRIGLHPRAHRGNAGVIAKVFRKPGNIPELVEERDLGAAGAGKGYKSFVLDPPVTVDTASFCVGYETYGGDVQLAAAVNDMSPIAGPSYIEMFDTDGCTYGPLALVELYDMPPGLVPRYCLDVDIAGG